MPGPGVSSNTTFEIYQYDGLSRTIHAQDNDSVIERNYDSLSHVIREILNGETNSSTYDGVGNMLSVVTCTYDQLEGKEIITDQMGLVATYDYIGPRRVERRGYGNGTRTDYTYDGVTGTPNTTNDFGVKRIIRTAHTRNFRWSSTR